MTALYFYTDFNSASFTLTVLANVEELGIPANLISTIDDELNENEEGFYLVAKVLGEAASQTCFHATEHEKCFGSTGATLIKLRDNDGT